MTTITFRVTPDPDGGYVASAIGHSIVTQAETQWELDLNARDAVVAHFGKPALVRFHPILDDELVEGLSVFSACCWTNIPGEHPIPYQGAFDGFDEELKYSGDFWILAEAADHAS